MDIHHGHIITGNLEIITNKNVKFLMKFGTKFRLNQKISFKKALFNFNNDINTFIKKVSYCYNYPLEAFLEWKSVFIEEFKNFLSNHLNNSNYVYHSLDKEDLKFIKDFQANFVIVPVDKSSNNYAIVCKKFYFQKIKEELLNQNFYSKINVKKDPILKKFAAFKKKCISMFSYKFNYSNHQKIPFIFMMPKFHKVPVKFRFICCTSKSVNKNFNLTLQKFLKQVYGFLKFKFKNTSYFWSIDNSYEVLKKLNFIPNRVQVFDFESLFSNIPINILYKSIKDILDLFSIEEELNIDAEFLLTLCNFCFLNNYVTFNEEVFLQTCGIGMGTNYSSTAANLFLFYFEYWYTVKHNKKLRIFRYIDDILVFNFDLNEEWNLIYPSYLKLNKSNLIDSYAAFLDISFSILNNKLNLDLYDKRKNFNFFSISMPHWHSNLHKKVFINILINQLNRFNKICNNSFNLKKQIFLFIANLYYYNNFPLAFLRHYVKIFLKQYWQIFIA